MKACFKLCCADGMLSERKAGVLRHLVEKMAIQLCVRASVRARLCTARNKRN
jgi:hypothetical protein